MYIMVEVVAHCPHVSLMLIIVFNYVNRAEELYISHLQMAIHEFLNGPTLHSTLKPFCVTTGSTVITTIPLCSELGSTWEVQCIAVSIKFLPTYLTESCRHTECMCSSCLEVQLARLATLYSQCFRLNAVHCEQ